MHSGLKFDLNYKTVEKAINKLPRLVENTVKAYTKKTAEQFLRHLKNGIRKGTLNLLPPQYREGNALYDTGELHDSLGLRKYVGGRRRGVYHVGAISGRKHKRSGLLVSKLMKIHEYGITVRSSSQAGNTFLIRIPPRPALRIAYKQFIRNATFRGERNKALNKVIRHFIKTASIKTDVITKL